MPRTRTALLLTLAGLLSLATSRPAGATSLEIEYAALERMIVRTVLTQGGRWFLDGHDVTECTYAFVQDPHVDRHLGRLRITLLFSGRQAVAVGDRCLGPGGTSRIEVSGVPRFVGGEIVLDELAVDSPGRAELILRLAGPMLKPQLAERLRLPLKRVLGFAAYELSVSHGVQMSFENLHIPRIEVGERSLLIHFDADVVVR